MSVPEILTYDEAPQRKIARARLVSAEAPGYRRPPRGAEGF
jgi:hypothetical protein